jgi:hypothetical protein
MITIDLPSSNLLKTGIKGKKMQIMKQNLLGKYASFQETLKITWQ